MLRLDPHEESELDEQESKIHNPGLTLPKTKLKIPTKSYDDCPSKNDRNRRHLPTLFSKKDYEFDNNNLTNLDYVTVKRGPTQDNEITNKKYVDNTFNVYI